MRKLRGTKRSGKAWRSKTPTSVFLERRALDARVALALAFLWVHRPTRGECVCKNNHLLHAPPPLPYAADASQDGLDAGADRPPPEVSGIPACTGVGVSSGVVGDSVLGKRAAVHHPVGGGGDGGGEGGGDGPLGASPSQRCPSTQSEDPAHPGAPQKRWWSSGSSPSRRRQR